MKIDVPDAMDVPLPVLSLRKGFLPSRELELRCYEMKKEQFFAHEFVSSASRHLAS